MSEPILTLGENVEFDEDTDGNAVLRNTETGQELTVGDVLEIVDLEAKTAKVDSEPTDPDDVGRKADLDEKIDVDEKGSPDGVADLDGDAKIREGQIPALAITDVEVFDDESEVTDWTDAEQGDVAIVRDDDETGESYMLTTDDPTVWDNWQLLKAPRPPVDDVFGRTGSITANEEDYDDYYVQNGDYEVQKDGTDGTGVINFITEED